MNKLFLVLSLVCTVSWADNSAFDCSKSPGRDLCLKIRKAESYLRDCTGTSCYSLWRNYIVSLEQLSDFYYSNFLPKDAFTSDLGELAYEFSMDICKFEQTGDLDWIERITLAENRALVPLKEIQENAKMPVIKTCKKVSNR